MERKGDRRVGGQIRFVYEEPAVVVEDDGKRYLVVGDLHIGAERRFRQRGINIYKNEERMADKIKKIAKEFKAERIVLLGDIKESILYPDVQERKSIKDFFYRLEGMEMEVLRGNHDAHLDEITGRKVSDEFMTKNFAFLHGNKWPTEEAMMRRTIISGHSHVAVETVDRNGARYIEKAWLIAGRGREKGGYKKIEARELIVMPAFNELITGYPVGKKENGRKEGMNPLLGSGIFSYRNADIFGISGSYYGKVKSKE
jgi:Predicted ICC-like phosphoesterases